MDQKSLMVLVAFALIQLLGFSRGQKCYITGAVSFPKDVVLPDGITCLRAFTFQNVPDVFKQNLKFSQVNFSNSGRSSVGYVLSNFPITTFPASSLQVILDLYDATSASLRSQGDIINVKLIKGGQFTLAMQIDRLNNNKALAVRNLQKAKKNCARCTNDDRAALAAIENSLDVL